MKTFFFTILILLSCKVVGEQGYRIECLKSISQVRFSVESINDLYVSEGLEALGIFRNSKAGEISEHKCDLKETSIHIHVKRVSGGFSVVLKANRETIINQIVFYYSWVRGQRYGATRFSIAESFQSGEVFYNGKVEYSAAFPMKDLPFYHWQDIAFYVHLDTRDLKDRREFPVYIDSKIERKIYVERIREYAEYFGIPMTKVSI